MRTRKQMVARSAVAASETAEYRITQYCSIRTMEAEKRALRGSHFDGFGFGFGPKTPRHVDLYGVPVGSIVVKGQVTQNQTKTRR
jgi:hypothetical protein